MKEEKIKQIFAKYEERERIQGDCELTHVPDYNYVELAKELFSQIEPQDMLKIAELIKVYDEKKN